MEEDLLEMLTNSHRNLTSDKENSITSYLDLMKWLQQQDLMDKVIVPGFDFQLPIWNRCFCQES